VRIRFENIRYFTGNTAYLSGCSGRLGNGWVMLTMI
jgi:hypothetical protein